MKINTNSWHYKLIYNYSPLDPSRNLCAYFWQIIMALFLQFGGIVCGLVALLFLSYPIWARFIIAPWPIAFLSLILWMVILIPMYLAAREGSLTRNQLLNQEVYNCNENSFCRLIYEYLKAKKDKICPRLQFVDGEHKGVF